MVRCLEPSAKGVQSNEIKYCVCYENRSLGRWPVNYIRGHARGTTLGTGGVQESQVSIYGTLGYGPTMWVKSRKGGDILHSHDNKACQRIAYQLCR